MSCWWLPFHSCCGSALSDWRRSHRTTKSKRSGGRVITLAAQMSLFRGKNNCTLILSTTTQQGGTVHEDTFSASFLLSHKTERRLLNHMCSSLRSEAHLIHTTCCTVFCCLGFLPENYLNLSIPSDAAPQLSRMLYLYHRHWSGPLCQCQVLLCFES